MSFSFPTASTLSCRERRDLKEARKKAAKTQKSQKNGYKFQNYTEVIQAIAQDSGPLQDYELAMAANDEAVDLPPTYAALQKKCGDVITRCRLLEEKIMTLKGDTSVKKSQIGQQAKRYKGSPCDYLSEDGEFPPRQDFRKAGIPPSAIVPQTAVRQPIIDTSVLGVLHTTGYDPGRYTSTSQQHFLPPPTPVIPQVPTHGPVVHSSSRSPRQSSVPQPSPVQELPNYPRLISTGCERRTVVQGNASVIDTSVLGVMSTTRYRCFHRSSAEGQPDLDSQVPLWTNPQTIPVKIPKPRGQPHTIPASLRRSGQPPTPKTSSPVPNVIKPLSSTTSTSSGQRMAYSGGFQSSSSALPMDSTARNHTPPSALPTASVQPARPRHAKLATLLEHGPDEHDARLWRFESHGLYNPQNMCFRNAGLQGLIHTSVFARLFLQLGDVLNRDEFGHIAPLVHATIEFVRMFYHQVEDRRPEADSWVTRDLSTGFYLNPTKLSDALANALPRFFTSQPIAVQPDQFSPTFVKADLVYYKATFQSEEDCGEFLVEYLSVLNVEFDMIRRSLSSPTWKPSAQELRREYDGYRFESTKETAVYRLFSTLISETPEFLLRLPITRLRDLASRTPQLPEAVWDTLFDRIPIDLWHKPALLFEKVRHWGHIKEMLLLLEAEVPYLARLKKWSKRMRTEITYCH
ncbi:hypothetical protein BDZ89DRAFT_1143471 [Hymenopellis radicata]|nr:hypothetical protein BDZ89DRAFT_1143471 [Hymenopellis radicata]